MLRYAIGAVLAAAAVAIAAVGPVAPETIPATSQRQRTVEIQCGGYDAEGRLVSPEAAAIREVPVDAAGRLHIPPVCGGYTADGVFIGDV